MRIIFLILLICNVCVFGFTEDETFITTWEDSGATSISFGQYSSYEIDAEGFKSLTHEEAMGIAAAINIFDSSGFVGDKLANAIFEKFIPERFKVGSEVK